MGLHPPIQITTAITCIFVWRRHNRVPVGIWPHTRLQTLDDISSLAQIAAVTEMMPCRFASTPPNDINLWALACRVLSVQCFGSASNKMNSFGHLNQGAKKIKFVIF